MSGSQDGVEHEEHATVLVVDPDGVSRRFVELALAAAGGFKVESVRGADGALEVLATSLVEVILAETRLEDADGLGLFNRLQQQSRLRGIPVIFISADSRVATKVAALKAGAADYIVKPVDPLELATRVGLHVARRRTERIAYLNRTDALAGSFAALPLPDLVNILHYSQASGIVSIEAESGAARLVLERGRILHASFGNLDGREAFYQLLRERRGYFEYEIGAQVPDVTRQLIDESPTSLLMEGSRLMDEARQGEQSPAGSGGGPAERPAPHARKGDRHLAASDLDVFAGGISHAFALGEIKLLTSSQLELWVKKEPPARLHVLLLADVENGISAMMALASPLGETELVMGLEASPKVATLAFRLRNDYLLDVVLLDARNPGRFASALTRAPDALILAPPMGDFLSIGARARSELVELITRCLPKVVLGLGNAAIAASLAELGVLTRARVHVECHRGVLGDGATDLRRVLIEAVRCRARADASAA